jgi:hypothetical protein
MEAADAGIRLVCSITDGIPAQDMMRVKRYLLRYSREHRTMMVGPNRAGIISPGKAMLGIMPGHIYKQGSVGIVSRSGTLGYEAASQMKALGIGITTRYWADQWHAAQTRMLVACRAYGLRPIDGPFGDFSDSDGYIAAAKRAGVLGYEGKWAIHPSQIELANQVFTPSEAEVTKARRIVSAMADAAKPGKGAVSLDGRLIDIASIRMAEALLKKAPRWVPQPQGSE